MANRRAGWPAVFCGLALVALTLWSGLTGRASAADEGINLQISPLPIELSTTPGGTVSADLRVRNAGLQTEDLAVTLKKFRVVGDEGNVVIEDRSPSDTYFDWVKFSRSSFTAPSNQWQTVKMPITPPKTAAFGYYYAVEFSRAHPTRASGGKSAIEGAVASFVLLDVKSPGAQRTAQVAEFSSAKQMYEFLPAKFKVKVRNTGNVHVAPGGNIFIQPAGSTSQIATLSLNPQSGSVLPQSNRVFTVQWKDGFPVYLPKTQDGQPVLDKNGQPVYTLKWDFSQVPKLRIGKYTAKLLMVYDNGSRDVPIEGTVSFWVVPWRLLTGLLLVAIFMTIGLWSTFQRLWRRIFKHRPAR